MAAIITIFGWALFSSWSAIPAGTSLGELKGKVWRVGLMGHSSRKENVLLLLSALEKIVKA